MMKASGNEDILTWDVWVYDKATGQIVKSEAVFEEPMDFPAFGGRMAALLLYEGPPEDYRSRQNISYGLIFRSSEIRSLRFELRLIYPDPGREIKSNIETILYGPNGKEITKRTIDATVYKGWKNGRMSGMWENRGKTEWDKGIYRAVFLNGQKIFAECPFEVR